ncbi:hypothetical protein A0J61_08519 [Choanephora cucurbitarum]|uniref:Uncharacterized protein n=1 Tax=Choanephora cucurbitarum TaxID=101091 RepID=A0A1C7N7X6_9FUNG|nr:hypothetical protein A0J61_08519 [Choanephora cucurbitarum]
MKIEMSCRKVVAVKAVIALVVVATTSLSHRLGQLASIFLLNISRLTTSCLYHKDVFSQAEE